MKPFRSRSWIPLVLCAAAVSPAIPAGATNLNLGADYMVRGVGIKERDSTFPGDHYYDQRLQGYMIADLSEDVEATVRVQSITPWGLESSTTPLITRYPNANGGLWLQNAFIRLPKIYQDKAVLTIGRQPIQWGDGLILGDDELGFNAIRLQLKSPWEQLGADLDVFTAKISEGLQTSQDTNLSGALLGIDRDLVRWELMGLFENSNNLQNYEAGSDTTTTVATKIDRKIFGARIRTTVKDAYIRAEYYIQNGSVRRLPPSQDIKLGGSAYSIGLGAKANTERYGRFGAVGEYSESSGDDPNTQGQDEAFRPTFASRWSGLERKGWGRYFAATLADAYSPTSPFAPASSTNTGLPPGESGIQSIHIGIEATPWAKWTFTVDYYQYKANKSVTGPKDLGTEFDYGVVFRYSGLVYFRGSTNLFTPGTAYQFASTTTQKASESDIQASLKF